MRGPAFSRRDAIRTIGAIGVAGLGVGSVSAATEDDAPAQQAPPGGGQQGTPGWLQARNAVIRIETNGTYDFPDFGDFELTSGGSGFVIDPSGVAVTANHVVTGAATLEVFLGDDTQESYNARVLGSSECSDLSVIQLQGSGFPALNFAPQPAGPGTEVFSHGFPINSVRLSTTNGIVSRTDVPGESDWASVDSVLEHTARINPGNSGGPLVDRQGRVVGINYASYFGLDQNLAIGSDVAQPIVSTLRQGQNQEYIGINGVAIETDTPMTADGINRAIHVVSVQTGSPAYNAGIRAGDRIIRVENTRAVRPAAEDPLPTKEFYCDVLRTQGSGNPIAVQVLRQAPGQTGGGILLEGVVNGQPLQVVETIEAPQDVYQNYTQVSDDSGTISVDVPTEWSDVRSVEGEIGPMLYASPNVNQYLDTWDVPGVWVLVSDQLETDPGAVLDSLAFTGCGSVSRSSFSNDQLTGQMDRYESCGGGSTAEVNIAAVPDDQSYVVFANVQLVTARDEEALGNVQTSLSVQGFEGTGGGTATPPDGETEEPPGGGTEPPPGDETETPPGTETPPTDEPTRELRRLGPSAFDP